VKVTEFAVEINFIAPVPDFFKLEFFGVLETWRFFLFIVKKRKSFAKFPNRERQFHFS